MMKISESMMQVRPKPVIKFQVLTIFEKDSFFVCYRTLITFLLSKTVSAFKGSAGHELSGFRKNS